MDSDSLVARRSKRSTAGNRMEAALAEFKAEDLGMDIDEDADFAMDRDEEDVFESDFESTDEEGEQEEVDAAAEKLIRQEESRIRKTARTQLERITALAHARQAVTFNPSAIETPSKEKQKLETKIKRHVSLGAVVNAETGEVLEGGPEDVDVDVPTGTALTRRHSLRAHTVANTSASANRSMVEVRKQSSTPKRAKTETKAPTQEELMGRALAMEEGNIEQHKNYLTLEEEKRKKARVVRASVRGPLVRWVSKQEEVTVLVQPPPPPPPPPAPVMPPPPVSPYVHYRYQPPSSPSSNASTYTYAPLQSSWASYTPAQYIPPHSPSQYTPSPASPSPLQSFQWPPPPQPRPGYLHPSQGSAPAVVPSPAPTSAPAYPYYPSAAPVSTLPAPPVAPPAPPSPIERKEKVAKQYVVHELGQVEKISRPNWNATMTAMFGDHADWENMRVYTAKGRPFTRPTQICPITGKVAKYLDPRTNVPYADLGAYKVLSAVLRHEYVWSQQFGCYVSREGSVFSQGGT